ncbi:MAG: IS1595 family transposase [bacterium]|nr:IS1595 family transposase [bacterium]
MRFRTSSRSSTCPLLPGQGDEIESDYNREVCNGNICHVDEVQLEESTVTVAYDGHLVFYSPADLDAMVPAYAVTIHKSQGSEHPVIVIPVLPQHYTILRRNLRRYFSVKTGTAIERSCVPLRKWVFAIYLELTGLKGVSSMKLHRDVEVTQKTAWFMLHRIREGLLGRNDDDDDPFTGAVEADETYVGGKKDPRHPGRGAVGKAIVAGVKDRETKRVRARVVTDTKKATLHGFVQETTDTEQATVYTDELRSYIGVAKDHQTVRHSAREFVDGMAHTNGIESFWATLKRAYHGTYHCFSHKHVDRYVAKFTAKHNLRDEGTADQMGAVVTGMVGRRLTYARLTG